MMATMPVTDRIAALERQANLATRPGVPGSRNR